MDPDKYQQAWRTESSQTRVTVDANLLLKEVQRNQREFRATILRRDMIEIGVGLLLLPVWFYIGATSAQPWSWYLTVPAIIWVIGFFLVDRMRHPQKPSEPDEPLLQCVTNSLIQVEHQIWLLRNVFWWYLMPFTISIQTYFAHVAWSTSEGWLEALGKATPFFIFLVSLYSFVDYINQRAVRSDLAPRRRELLTLLASLGSDGSTGEPAKMETDSPERVERSGVLRRWLAVTVSCFVAFIVLTLAGGSFDSNYDQPPPSSGPEGDSLAKLVTDLRQEKNLVGLAAMVMADGQVEAAAAHGERKNGSGVSLQTGDRWHLGGITKSITATMIARLVESGQMQWSDTLGSSFPDATLHDDWKPVTLEQLLTDTAGAPANFSSEVGRKRPALGPECTAARREAVLEVIAEKPVSPPGEEYVYSNVGHTIAGAMAEQATGKTWEDLVKREVFEPLKLTSAGFGPPKSPDETLEQPRGHRTRFARKFPVDDETDNSPIMGPSGSIHMTLHDLCIYATDHLRGELGKGQLLSAETYKLLHTTPFGDYAFGWIKSFPTKRIPHTFYWHNGSNTMWYALVVFIPETKMVVAVTSNDGDSANAEEAAWEIVYASTKPSNAEADYSKKSPFAAVRWKQSQPEVKIGDEWFKLVSLNELPATQIVTFSQRTYEDKWQKRFEEDLVELLTRMGHEPQETVRLVVMPLGSSTTRTLENVPMTKANRQAIRAAAQTRDPSELE